MKMRDSASSDASFSRRLPSCLLLLLLAGLSACHGSLSLSQSKNHCYQQRNHLLFAGPMITRTTTRRAPPSPPPSPLPGRRPRSLALWDAPKPLWTLKPSSRPFKSIRETRSGPAEAPGGGSGGKTGKSDFFREFRLTEASSGKPVVDENSVETAVRGLVWFLSLLWPHITFGFFCSAVVQILSNYEVPLPLLSEDLPDLQRIHGFVGTILGFSIGFRTNAAYDRFYEGRKILSNIMEHSRSIIRDAYSFLLKPGGGGDEEEVRLVCDDIRRRLDVLFAFIRQSVRESVLGFPPSSGMADVPFTETTYYLDTSKPQLVDLLTAAEAERYSRFPARARPSTVAAEINIIFQILGSRFHYTDAFLGKAQGHLYQILESHATMIRIRDTPLPYPYVLILSVATFLFVYATPFIYNAGPEGRLFGVQFLVFSYYGILQIGESIENPLDLEAFAINLQNDTKTSAQAHGEDRRGFLPEYLTEE